MLISGDSSWGHQVNPLIRINPNPLTRLNPNPLIILKDYIDKGIVSYFYRPKLASQVENYRNIFAKYIWTQSYWVAVIDLDGVVVASL